MFNLIVLKCTFYAIFALLVLIIWELLEILRYQDGEFIAVQT